MRICIEIKEHYHYEYKNYNTVQFAESIDKKLYSIDKCLCDKRDCLKSNKKKHQNCTDRRTPSSFRSFKSQIDVFSSTNQWRFFF